MITEHEYELLRGMTDKEIERALDICQAQIPMAYEQRNTKALEQLQEWEMSYIDERVRRLS